MKHGAIVLNWLILICKNREVKKDYLFDVIRFWIHEFDIDSIRLDLCRLSGF